MTGPYTDAHTHEALHLTQVLTDTLRSYVSNSRCAEEFLDVKSAAQKAEQALGDLYQLIGEKLR